VRVVSSRSAAPPSILATSLIAAIGVAIVAAPLDDAYA
jgi:hypothetical protein